ncbi:MAG: FG-GAP-like repeat-containing protein [Lyngbya sp.]|nr:FG-GAP-like repeat-containing protein [Lyngbya sp.]
MVFTPDNTIVDILNLNILVGTSGSDQIIGLAGDDLIFGAEADDQLFGNEAADTIYGNQENDIIYGGSDADLLFGGQGDDSIFGDDGDDTIYADRGTDILIGGEGADVFILDIGTGDFSVTTTNLIVDFNLEEDQIELQDGLTFEDFSIEGTPEGDTAIRDPNTGEILALLQGVNRDSFTEIVSSEPTVPPEEPIVTASLADDTGIDNGDNITSNPTLTGTITNSAEVAGLEVSIGEEFVPIETNIADNGSFTLTQEQLEEALDISFTNGIYTIQLRTVDLSGTLSSEVAEITFTIAPDDPPPEQEIEFFPPGTDFLEPTITAELANDTGTNDSDGITSDPTIIGTATDNFGVAEIEVSVGEEFVPIQTNIAANGSFTLTQNQLEEALETSLTDGTYTVSLRAVDTSELRSLELAEVTFTLETPNPDNSGSEPDTSDPDNSGEPDTSNPDNSGEPDTSNPDNSGSEPDTSNPDNSGEPNQPPEEDITIPESVEDTPTNSIENEDFPDPFETENVDLIEDPGNTILEAYEISINSQTFVYSQQISADDPVDFYVFNVENNQNFNLFLEGLSQDVDVYLLDINQQIIASSENIGITAESITVPLSVGTYYVQVQSFDSQTTTYDLNILFPPRTPEVAEPEVIEIVEDPGNIVTEAYEISIDSQTSIYSQQVSANDPVDYYIFNVENEQNFNLFLESLSQDVNISVLDINQTVVASSENVGTTDESINLSLTAGTYYIQVESFDSQTTTYNLNVLFPPAPSETESLVRYDFVYYSNGINTESDYYTGYVYAEEGSFEVGERYDFSSSSEGSYYIADISSASSTAIVNQVFINNYYDVDININSTVSYSSFYSINNQASGFFGLGSEYDFVEFEGIFFGFGLQFVTTNIVLPIFINPNFPQRDDYFVGDRPSGITSADLDGDGDNDLIVGNPGFDAAVEGSFDGNRISILTNNGDGTFTAPRSIITGLGPSFIAEDLDGDEDIDLATAHAEDDDLSVFFNDGNGNFATPETYEAGDRPFMANAGDLDNDGDIDLVTINSEALNLFTANNEGNSISIHYNDGDGGFTERETLTVGEGVSGVEIADLDDDGNLDLITSNRSENTLSVLFNTGDAFFTSPEKYAVGERPGSPIAADLDNDGDLDLATANFANRFTQGTVSILRNDGNGNFSPSEFFFSENVPSNLTPADLDGDGDLDLMMLNSFFIVGTGEREGSIVSVLTNNGDGNFSFPESFLVGEIPNGLVVDDLDEEGDLDFATANFDSDDVTVYLQS